MEVPSRSSAAIKFSKVFNDVPAAVLSRVHHDHIFRETGIAAIIRQFGISQPRPLRLDMIVVVVGKELNRQNRLGNRCGGGTGQGLRF